MSKFFKLSCAFGGVAVNIHIMSSIDGDIEGSYSLPHIPRTLDIFERFDQWSSVGHLPWETLDFSPVIIGNYKFTVDSIWNVQKVDQSTEKARVLACQEMVRGKVELVNSHKASTLSSDIETYFSGKQFP